MKSRPAIVMFITLGLAAWTMATAQRATEVYIPIGESPGVSGSESVIGTIADIEYEQHSMQVSSGGKFHTVHIAPDTRFYLDRSGDKERSVTGSFADCREGRRIEAWVNDDGDAIWIKIAAD